MSRRVVVTGLGAVTPVGNDVDTFWRSVKNGESGIDHIASFDVSDYPSKIAGEVRDLDPGDADIRELLDVLSLQEAVSREDDCRGSQTCLNLLSGPVIRRIGL